LRKRSYFYILAILISGFLLSGYCYVKISLYERQKNDEALSSQARNIANEFQKFLLNKYNTLRYMKAYFYAYEDIGLSEFELFSTSILLFEPDIDSLLFVLELDTSAYTDYAQYYESTYAKVPPPLDNTKDGDRLYVAHYVKSFAEAPQKTGENVANNPRIYDALRGAFEDTAPKMVFLDPAEMQGTHNVYIVDPLFSIDKNTQTIKDRIHIANYFAEHGYIFMGLDLHKFIKNQDQLLSQGLCLTLSYKHQGGFNTLFDSQQECNGQAAQSEYDIDFSLFGVDWHLAFAPRGNEAVAYIWQKYFVLYGGMIFSILIAAYFYIILWQRAQERIAQRKLNEEIAKKEQLNLQMQDYTDKLELARLQQMDIYRSLQEEKLKAEQANKTKSDFLANMSHELRTPLNSIIGIAKIIREDVEDKPETLEMVDILESASQALLDIVNDILDLSKIEAGKVQLECIDFDMKDIINNVTASLKPIADRKGLYLNTKFNQNEFPLLKGDPLRVSRILMNLIGNAVKYTVEGGVTTVIDYTIENNEKLILHCSVSDTGIGISKDKVSHIFEKFTQADDTTTRTFGGTGLGLTITQDLLNMMGGFIKVDSVEGLGSTFSFDLPIRLSEHDADEQLPATHVIYEANGDGQTDFEARVKNARILVVEDNEFNVILIRKFLKKIGFTDAVYAKDGAEGVDAVRNEAPFDIVLMDCHMPVKSGYAATEEIRALEADTNGAVENVPIIALTADAMVGVKEKCLKSGMNDYLSKPVDFKDLRAVIKKWLMYDKRDAA